MTQGVKTSIDVDRLLRGLASECRHQEIPPEDRSKLRIAYHGMIRLVLDFWTTVEELKVLEVSSIIMSRVDADCGGFVNVGWRRLRINDARDPHIQDCYY